MTFFPFPQEGIPIRVYSEENLFKTIIVGPPTTVLDAIKSASSKFKGGKPDLFTMRMVAGGKGGNMFHGYFLFSYFKHVVV